MSSTLPKTTLDEVYESLIPPYFISAKDLKKKIDNFFNSMKNDFSPEFDFSKQNYNEKPFNYN